MKIVYCLPQLYRPGGIERIVCTKATYLAEVEGFEVVLVLADQKNKPSFYDLSDSIKIYNLGLDYDATLTMPILKRLYSRFLLHRRHYRQLAKILYFERPDITISTFTHESSFLPDIKDGSKKILEFHFCREYQVFKAKYISKTLISKILARIRCWQEENIIIPKYTKFVVLTREDRDLWSSKISNVIEIPNIALVSSQEPNNSDSKHAIAVGRLDGQKGFDRLIEIWEEIVKKHPDWILDIFGKGNDKYILENMIFQKGLSKNIYIHEPTQDIMQKYRESAFCLMTSNYEGWALVISEAMSCGIPVIAYGCPCGPRDIIKEDIDGFCVDNGDKRSFVEKIHYLIENPAKRKELGINARKNIERYSLSNVMPKWLFLFNSL